jgi:acetyltransferase-like isoleucine patch superfamily enzyme
MFARLNAYLPKIRMLLNNWRFASVGARASLGRNVRLHGNVRISIGARSALRDNVQIGGNGELTIGDRTAINDGCIITAMERVTIGDDVMLAPRVYVLDVDHTFQRRDLPISQQGYAIAPVTIGDGAWIGTGAVITRGVTIGEGAIVGANSVVTRDVPPFMIVGGVPAQVIRERP